MNGIHQLLPGAICMGYAVSGLFFFKFWSRTRDQLFVSFALALWVLALLRIAQSMLVQENELKAFLYFARLPAYGFILWNILRKNFRK